MEIFFDRKDWGKDEMKKLWEPKYPSSLIADSEE